MIGGYLASRCLTRSAGLLNPSWILKDGKVVEVKMYVSAIAWDVVGNGLLSEVVLNHCVQHTGVQGAQLVAGVFIACWFVELYSIRTSFLAPILFLAGLI